MLATLLNRPVTIVKRTDSGDVDAHGNEVQTETLVETVGELQQRQRQEPQLSGELADTQWLLVVPAATDLDTGDAVVVAGEVFEVIGEPWRARNPRTKVDSHMEATLRRTAGDDEES